MTCSAARLIANQKNALKSTGPKTPEGKAVSRRNALKHGLTGDGIALLDEDAANVNRRFDDLKADLRPTGPMAEILTHRIAFLSVRLERCERQEAKHINERMRHAVVAHDEAILTEIAALLDGLNDEPATNARRLLRTPQGVETAIGLWRDLKADLLRPSPRSWTAAHGERAVNLTGRGTDEVPVPPILRISNAVAGNFGLLSRDEGADLDDEDRQAWARDRLASMIDDELEALHACLDALDHDAFELDREEAPTRALFDPSKEATLARRYEAAAERGMFRSLRDLRQLERDHAGRPPVSSTLYDPALGSFGAEPEPEPPSPQDIIPIEPARQEPLEAESTPASTPPPVRAASTLARSIRLEIPSEAASVEFRHLDPAARPSVEPFRELATTESVR
jgi:hypothetical protein